MKEAFRHLAISYVPLMTGTAGEPLPTDSSSLEGLVRHVQSLPDGFAKAILWQASPEGDPWPIFVIQDAQALFDHLVEWSEGSPDFWFDLRMAIRGNDYAIGLVPRIARSIERFKIAWELRNGNPVPEDSEFYVLYKSIRFSSSPGQTSTFEIVKPILKPTAMVGFLDSSELEDLSEIPKGLDFSKISWIGPFDILEDENDHLRSIMPKSRNRAKAERRSRR